MSITERSATMADQVTDRRHWTGVPSTSRWLMEARHLVPVLAEQADRLDESGAFVDEAMQLLKQHRFMSMLVPTELGGGGATHAEACAVLAELAHGDPATSLTFAMHTHLVAAQVWRHHHGLPAPVLARLAETELVLVSTGAADWLDSSGSAERVEGGYRISGRKAPSSGAPAGDVLVTSVRWDDAPDGPQVVHASLPFTADGVSIDETWDTTGMRATGSHTVVLDEVFVPDASVPLVRPAGVWHPVWATVVGAAMPLIMSTYVGVAESAARRALELAAAHPERPGTAAATGRMLNSLATAQDTIAATIAMSDDLRFDNDLELAAGVLSRKTVAAEACIDTVRWALEVGGGAAFATSSGIGRLMRDVHGVLYHPLPTARQEEFTGRVALGLDPVTGT
jgi:acyl-CoA dehydrogenase